MPRAFLSRDCPRTITLPDIVSYCNFPLRINPNGDAATVASVDWISSQCQFSARQKAAMDRFKVGPLAAMAYPVCDLPALRLCADWLHYILWLDDLTDGMSVEDAVKVQDLTADIMRNLAEYRVQVESGEASTLMRVTYDLWSRVLPLCGPGLQRRFIEGMRVYLDGVRGQSAHRALKTIDTLEEYIHLRRADGALIPVFALLEYGCGFELPDVVCEHAVIKRLEDATTDLSVWMNDLYSFNKEQADGDRNLLVFVIMEEKGLSMQEAVDFAGDMIHARFKDFEEDWKKLPSWGEHLDRNVAAYVQGLADWLARNLHWAFVTPRYLGNKAAEIKQHRVVELLPS